MGDSLFTPTEVTADLHTLEKLIHQLGVDYELFFAARADGKNNVLPPQRRLAETEAIVRHYTKHPPRRTADRFRFNTLVHRFRMNGERWARRIRQQEEMGIGRGVTAAAVRRERREALDKPQVLATTRAVEGQATGGQVRDIYMAYRTARRNRGLAVSELDYAPFADKLAERLDKARQKSPGRDLELRVDEVDGMVRIAVRPVASRDAEPVTTGRGSSSAE